MRSADVVSRVVAAINAQDVPAIVALCTQDHAFIDAHGNVVPAAGLEAAWRGYFAFMPRYGIEVETMLTEGDTVAVFGHAWGQLASGAAWRRPAAWQARVVDGKLQRLQVYVDTKAVFDLMTG
jgi:ketosteroid isomerase-like protein